MFCILSKKSSIYLVCDEDNQLFYEDSAAFWEWAKSEGISVRFSDRYEDHDIDFPLVMLEVFRGTPDFMCGSFHFSADREVLELVYAYDEIIIEIPSFVEHFYFDTYYEESVFSHCKGNLKVINHSSLDDISYLFAFMHNPI